MSDLSVSSLSIDELLRKLRAREWLVPQFQRDFVWATSNVIDLIHSILCARPVGMATIWEQPDNTGLQLEPLSLPDRTPTGEPSCTQFSNTATNPKKFFAVLDGLQRCTAIAMAFGGFRSKHGGFKLSGRYFLNVAEKDPLEQIIFIKESDVCSKNFDNDATCIAQGLFPLSSNTPEESMLAQWLRYIQSIRNPAFYPNGSLPGDKELDRRDSILKHAFEGINRTRLAIYVVPETYTLADICEIFETLNTTGTKVSTVDLIHSWIYAETAKEPEGSKLLRDWIDDFGQKDGAIGWSAANDRPELVVQIATACYIALENKPAPRMLGRAKPTDISTVKAGDLLATPTRHWKAFFSHDTQIATFLGDFQRCVAGGLFPWTACPYPVTAAIYVALRYHASLDDPDTHPWGQDDLNALFRAFFWRNALTNRYDQGFLTQLGTDLKEIKSWLVSRAKFPSSSQWAKVVDDKLTALIDRPIPDPSELIEYLSDGRPGGATQKALLLPMIARAQNDLLDEKLHIGFPDDIGGVELHHIYPKSWCNNNRTGILAEILNPQQAGRDWVNSIANLMPLSRQSNNIWKAKIPDQVLEEKGITYQYSAAILRNAFIDETCFNYLKAGSSHIKEFWQRRSSLIATDLIRKTAVIL